MIHKKSTYVSFSWMPQTKDLGQYESCDRERDLAGALAASPILMLVIICLKENSIYCTFPEMTVGPFYFIVFSLLFALNLTVC